MGMEESAEITNFFTRPRISGKTSRADAQESCIRLPTFRRHNTIAAGVSVHSQLPAEEPMKTLFFKSLWGMAGQGTADEKLRRIKEAGYDGVELTALEPDALEIWTCARITASNTSCSPSRHREGVRRERDGGSEVKADADCGTQRTRPMSL